MWDRNPKTTSSLRVLEELKKSIKDNFGAKVSEIDFDQWFRWNCPVNDTAQRVWLDKGAELVRRENNQ